MAARYSFIMPAYKAKYLKESIKSILSQTYHDFELIIVDDASPENLNDIVKEFEDNRIQYYRNKNNIGGNNLIDQWNVCLSRAKGEYVILATDDDVYHQDYLKEINRLVEKYPKCYAFRPRCVIINGEGNVESIDAFMPEMVDLSCFLYYFLTRTIKTGIGFWTFNREYLVKRGGYVNMPMAWYSDDLTCLEMAVNGVAFSPQPLFYFRYSGMSISTSQNNRRALARKIKAGNLFVDSLSHIITGSRNQILDKELEYPNLKALKELYYGHFRMLIMMTGKMDLIRSIPEVMRAKHISIRFKIKSIIIRLLK